MNPNIGSVVKISKDNDNYSIGEVIFKSKTKFLIKVTFKIGNSYGWVFRPGLLSDSVVNDIQIKDGDTVFWVSNNFWNVNKFEIIKNNNNAKSFLTE